MDDLMHCTRELFEAMQGHEPDVYTATRGEWEKICGRKGWGAFATSGGVKGKTHPDPTLEPPNSDRVTCPECLRIMWDAIPPVRRDWLLEQGLLTEYERMEPLEPI